MTSFKITIISIITLFVLSIIFLVSQYIIYANYGARTESLIKSTYINNQNILAQYGQKIAETTQVPSMYKDDLKEITTAAISGRYGEDGSKAAFQWLKEQNPQLDNKLYRQIQQLIESGRNDFQNAQTTLIDIRRQYETKLSYIWSGFWLKQAGYPKINLATDYQPVTTSRAAETFKSGVEEPIKLRN